MSDQSDVIIAGAGPTGLTLGVELLLRGVPVRVMDRTERPHPHSRALVLWPRSLEILDRLGIGQDIMNRSIEIHGQVYYSGGKRKARVNFDRLPGSRFTSPVSIPQQETESAIRERFEGLGGKVEYGVEVVGCQATAHGVKVMLKSDGRTWTENTPWLIGCDGAHSKVRELMGVDFPGAPYEQKFVLADGECVTDLAHDEAHHFMTNRGVLTVLGLPGGSFRVVASAPADLAVEDPIAFVQQAADERCPVPLKLVGEQKTGDFRVHRRLAERFKSGRVLILGDAAHINSPVGAQGLNTGIEDAHALGWRLAGVQGESWTAGILEDWAREREHMAKIVVADTDRQTRMWMLSGWRAVARDMLLTIAEHVGVLDRQVPSRLAQLSNAYPRQEAGIGSIRPGMRLPDVPTAAGWLRDALSLRKPTLFVFAADKQQSANRASARRLLANVEAGLTVSEAGRINAVLVARGDVSSRRGELHDPTGAVHSAVGASRPSVVLVRPDGIIELACRFDDPRIPKLINALVQPSLSKAAYVGIEAERE
ncbi:FAD-dependent monooxygenase [Streptomyces sp. NPDC002668]|uniref:FAD-dependent monooxygenase n=1 Tax=Streptomyces sp. NPDC002668 TaxID=3154422 RepID=UPI00332D61A3